MGGEGHGQVVPYETYVPPYLFSSFPRPQWAAPDPVETVTHGQTYQGGFSIAAGGSVAKVVFLRAGSVTHHFDQDQRYHGVAAEIDPEQAGLLSFTLPANRDLLPAGYYMGFLVSDQGIPSNARWFHVVAP
jgi:hypothetical protein